MENSKNKIKASIKERLALVASSLIYNLLKFSIIGS